MRKTDWVFVFDVPLTKLPALLQPPAEIDWAVRGTPLVSSLAKVTVNPRCAHTHTRA